MPPPTGEHPYVEALLVEAIGRYLHERAARAGWAPSQGIPARNRLVGRVACGEAGIRVRLPTDPDQVRGIDVGYFTAEQVRRIGPIPPREYAPEAPALVAEVISPSETGKTIEEKVADYFAAGARLVWLLQPERRTVRVRPRDGTEIVVTADGALNGGDVLPGFSVSVADLFAE